MELLCPECLGPLATTDGKNARCTVHGGSYRILFWREAPATPVRPMTGAMPLAGRLPADASPYAAPAPEVRSCPRHPDVYAPHTCSACMAPMCGTCSFPQPGGGQICPDCMAPAPVRMPPASRMLEGVMCSRHPEVQAVVRCQACSKPVCATCDFCLPGQIHVCPDCASRTDHRMSRKRKTMLGWSFAMAVWATLGMGVLFSGMLANVQGRAEVEVLGMALGLMIMIPSLVGLALAVSTFDRRLSNPGVIWVAVVWNSLMVAGFLLLSIIGTLMG